MAPSDGHRPVRFPIELGKVREFARATKASAPSFYQDSAPVVPPTYLTVAASWTPPDHEVLARLDLDWARLLHGGSSFVFRGTPPRAGDELWMSRRLEGVRAKQGARGGRMRLIDYVVDFADVDGSIVAQEFHTTIETGAAPTMPGRRPREALEPSDALARKQIEPFTDEPVSRTDIVRYQGASGDLNPIHHDDEYARNAGYSSAFSVGMLHAGILGSHVASYFGANRVRTFAVRFQQQVWPGDALTYRGWIRAATLGRVEADLRVESSAGTHLSGSVTVVGSE